MASMEPLLKENVSAPKQTPIFPEEFGVSKKTKRKSKAFKEAPYWDNLATKYLKSYQLPNWGVPASLDPLLVWMTRAGVTEARLMTVLGTTPDELLKLNRKWPMRAFIGVLLEIRDMKSNKTPKVG